MKTTIILSIIAFYLCISILPLFADNREEIKSLYKEGLLLYKKGKLAEAKEKLGEILKIDPGFAPARNKIRLLQDKEARLLRRDKKIAAEEMFLEVQRKWMPPEKPAEAKEVIPEEERFKTEQKKVMEEKARQVIPEINFTDARLRDVLQYIARISGINIVLDEDLFVRGPKGQLGIPVSVSAALEEEIEAEGEEEWEEEQKEDVVKEPSQVIISDRITITLRNIPLLEALKYILTAKGLKYRIDEYAIVVSTSQRLEQVEMETRYYHLTSGIGSFTEYVGAAKEEGEETFEWEEEETAEEKPTSLTIKDVLEQSGVPFPSGSKIFLDRRTGTLLVRNTPANLAVIEEILRILDITPYQVEIETRFVQVREDATSELGLEWMVKSEQFMFGLGGDKDYRLDNATMDAQSGQYPDTKGIDGKEGITRGLRYLTNADERGNSTGVPSGSLLSISGILTQPQFRMILHALNQSGKANLVSAPKVTTLNNQRAQIEMVEEFIYPEEYEITPPTVVGSSVSMLSQGIWFRIGEIRSEIVTPGIAVPVSFETRDVGIILNVIPNVGADRRTISLTLIPEISEFVDWIDYGIQKGTGWNKVPILKPIFQTRNVTTSVVINDGETVVLGGLIKEDIKESEDKIPLLGDIPLLGGLFRTKTKVSIKSNLIIFVTAKLLTPTGELVREAKVHVY